MNLHQYINEDLKNNYEYSEVLELDGIKKAYPTYDYDSLSKVKINAVPIALFDEDGKLKVSFTKEPTHCLAIGCTGSGKTTSLAIPKLHILSELENRPSFFVIDIKGELVKSVGQKLIDKGYKVRVIDLNEPELSCSWNPLSDIYDKYQYAHNLTKAVVVHTDDIKNYKNVKIGFKRKACEKWYMFNNICYGTINELNSSLKQAKEKILLEVGEEVNQFAHTMIEVTSTKDPHWEQTARDLFIGIVLSLLEKSIIPSKNRITKEQFNLMNIVDIATSYSEKMIEELFETCNRQMNAHKYASKIIYMDAKVTKSCYYTCLSTQLSQFKSYGIQKVTIDDTINMPNIGEEHVAIFLKMDDLNTANYSIAQLFVTRLYKNLCEISEKQESKALKIPMHFILDEFGNFPAFKNFGHMISVSRSRNIWFTMIVQSYYQLEIKYGVELTKVIVQNSNLQMFFGTNDYQTKEEFSRSCGKVTKLSETSYLNGKEDYITTYQTRQYDAVTISELSFIQPCSCYCIAFQEPVIKTYLKRSYMVDEFIYPLKTTFYNANKTFITDKKYVVTFDQVRNAPAIVGNESTEYQEEIEPTEKKKLPRLLSDKATTDIISLWQAFYYLGEEMPLPIIYNDFRFLIKNRVLPIEVISGLRQAYGIIKDGIDDIPHETILSAFSVETREDIYEKILFDYRLKAAVIYFDNNRTRSDVDTYMNNVLIQLQNSKVRLCKRLAKMIPGIIALVKNITDQEYEILKELI